MSTQKSISRVYSILFILVFMLALTFSALDVTPAHAAGILYAKPGGTGDYCSSWANACTLQTALTDAVSGDEIWVMDGTYTPGAARTATFQLKNSVVLYGGFAGMETARTQRNPAVNVTTLSGDIGTPGDNSDNSYHVVKGATGATLDGFTITAGNNANGTYPNDRGGGLYNDHSSPTLTNVTFSGNSAIYGGGMYNGYSSPALINVTFRDNSATYYGGGMYNEGNSMPTLTNITFSGNSATNGGGMYNSASNPMLTNVTFGGNSAGTGGGMYNGYSSSPQIRNTILWGNTAPSGAQIYNDSSTPVVSYSVVQDGYAGGTNIITADPKLGTLGNYGGFTQTIPLQAGSSAIDKGDDTTCAVTDQRGISRPQGAHCDIGAFELVDTTAPETTIIDKPANLDNDSTPTFTFSGDDGMGSGVASFMCSMDGGTYTDCTSPFISPTTLADGSHTFYVYAIDMLGNADATPAAYTWAVDSLSPNITSIVRASPNPTAAASVDFTVTFSEDVTGVDASDFTLTKTGTISGESVTGVSGGPIIYTVSVNTGTGSGNLRLDVPSSANITSTTGHLLAGLPYTDGERYSIGFYIFLPLILR